MKIYVYLQYYLARQAEVFVVDVNVVAPLFGNIVLREYGDYRAYRLAGGAVDALIRMDEILVVFVLGVDAVHRANIYAGAVFEVNTGFCNDIGHFSGVLLFLADVQLTHRPKAVPKGCAQRL